MKIRPEVMKFAEAMERKLRKNDHKGGWNTSEFWYLSTRLEEERRELDRAIIRAVRSNKWKAVIGEAVDVANFAMMIADNAALSDMGKEVA